MSTPYRYRMSGPRITCSSYRRRRRIDVNAPGGVLSHVALVLLTGAIVAMCLGVWL